MIRLLAIKAVKRPTTVRTLAKSVSMKGEISLLNLMHLLWPRPFYIIGHMCNNLAKVKWAVNAGANAIECDINFADADSEEEFEVYHDFTDTAVPIKPFLKDVASFLKTQPQVAMVYFDLKDADANRAERLLGIIRTHLSDVVPVHVIISHAHFAGRGFFIPIKDAIRDPGEGFIIDMDDSPQGVRDFFIGEGIVRHGYGNGVMASGIPWNIPLSIMEGVAIKWSEGTIRWVGTFTLASKVSMRDYIAKGVDGIIVNDVPALVEVFNQNAAKYHLRRATRDDDPFAPPLYPAYVLTVKTPFREDAGTDANLTFELRGTAGKIATTIDAFPRGLFDKGKTNRVTIIGRDVGTIQELWLSQDGTGQGPDWFVDTVKVQKRGSPSVTFNFNQEISANQPVKRTPG